MGTTGEGGKREKDDGCEGAGWSRGTRSALYIRIGCVLRTEGGKAEKRERGGDPRAPELLLQLSDEALLDLVVHFKELKGDENDNGLGLAHVHLLGRRNVKILQVCLPLRVVALFRRKRREVGSV